MIKHTHVLADAVTSVLRSAAARAAPAMLEEAIAIQQIAAPTFDEVRRANYVANRFRQLNLQDVYIDDLHNVFARIAGTNAQPGRTGLLVSAHTDTVFDRQTPLEVQRQPGRIIAPGIGDNSLGVAALLSAAELFRKTPLPSDLWLVANSREEGMGDLGGIKATYETLAPRIGAAVVLEGMALGHVYHAGIAVRRLNIRVHGQGGHSWLHFGRASAIHAIMQLGTQITKLQVPQIPRTTFNIGIIEGGTTVNSIASDAAMLLDLRSEDREALATLEKSVRQLIAEQPKDELTFTVDVVGDRPSGAISREHPLVQLARFSLEAVGAAALFEIGSTDANMLLAAGLPTVTIGITQGGNAHRTDEYIETAQLNDGLAQLFILLTAASAWINAV